MSGGPGVRNREVVDPGPELASAVARLEPGGRLVDMRPLTGGVSAEVLGFDIATADGGRRRVVLRRHRSDGLKQHARSIAAKEHALLAVLHARGFAVPEPYLLHDTDADGPYLLIEWIEGSTGVDAANLSAALDQMATFLVALHSLAHRSLGLPDLDQIEDPRIAIGPYLPPTDVGRRLGAVLASGAVGHDANRSVLLHGDYWPGNVLWRDGRLRAVLDWEDACLGDPLADLATARVELLCQYGPDAKDGFTERYLAMADDAFGPLQLDHLVLWDLYVSASALAGMGDWGLEPDEEARRRRLTESFFDRAARELG
jgi:aminoglycoside phosphotransferase (APT) family kinase protein